MKDIYSEGNITLKTKTVQGAGWFGISQTIRLLLHFGITVILAGWLHQMIFRCLPW